jgi:hypothetical protein
MYDPPYSGPVPFGHLIWDLHEEYPDMWQECATSDVGIIRYRDNHLLCIGHIHFPDEKRDTSSTSDPGHEAPIYPMLRQLRRILDRIHRKPTHLRELVYISNFLYLSSKYYRQILQSSPEFKQLRSNATAYIPTCRPDTKHRRNLLLHSSVLVVHAWRNGTVLEKPGVLIVKELKKRFPEMREWPKLRAMIKDEFGHLDLVLKEWEYNWNQDTS